MGYYKNLVIDILELNEAGLTPGAIADRLGIAVITVCNIIDQYSIEG